jgi:rhamnogalacturonan hydrolase
MCHGIPRGGHWYVFNSSLNSALNVAHSKIAISNIIYQNIYTWESNQMFMIKSNGGSGTVKNCQFNNFIGHTNAYSLDLNAYWSSIAAVAGNGILYEDLTFKNWKGTCANGATRAPMNVICPSGTPCTGITISDFAMWTEAGSVEYYKCENAYGSGGCLNTGSSHTSYAVSTSTIKSAP